MSRLGLIAAAAAVFMLVATGCRRTTPLEQVQTEQGQAGLPLASAAGSAWQDAAHLKNPRHSHTATLLSDGRVLAVGGWGSDMINYVGALPSVELYDPAGSGTWTLVSGKMASGRTDHTATLLPSGQVLVVGGTNDAPLATAELYDVTSDTWSAAGAMQWPDGTPRGRSRSTATLLSSGQVLIAGGENNGAQSYVDVYNPSLRTWSIAPNMRDPRAKHAAILLPSGKVFVFGGFQGEPFSTASAEFYDPANGGSWTFIASMSDSRGGLTATLLPSGKILVTGGKNTVGVLASAEIYNPSTDSWRSVGFMSTPRYLHTASVVAGKVIIAGGVGSDGNPLASVEAFDPATETWSSLADLPWSRGLHTATVVDKVGQLLVAGGWGPQPYSPGNGMLWVTATYATCNLISCNQPPGACNSPEGTCSAGTCSYGYLSAGSTGSPSCAPYVCGGTSGSCPSSCSTDSQCASADYCSGGACVPRGSNSTVCTAANQCASGNCVDGVCCDTACDGTCDTCNVAGKVGTCSPLVAGSAGGPSCAPYVCNGVSASCPTDCTNNSQCSTGYTCTATRCNDVTPPAGGGTLNDGTFSRSLTSSPALTWSAFTDTGSGLDHYEYAVGTTAGGADVKGWTAFTPGAGPGTTLTGLSLANGTTYYPSIRAYDRVGNFSTLTGNGWTVDTMGPSAPGGLNDGTVTNAASAAPTANWTASTDSGSGVASYEIAIGTSAGTTDVLAWTNIGNVTKFSVTGLTLGAGTTYYTSVRATDNVGNVGAVANGDGWTYTVSAPYTLVYMPMDNMGGTGSGNNASADFVNYATAGASFHPVQAPAISTVSPRFGSGSGSFQNGRLETTDSPGNVIGSSDFTIEFWVKYTGGLNPAFSYVVTGTGWNITLGNTNYNGTADFSFGSQGARWWGGAVGWGVLPTGVWQHLSVSRSGTSLYTHLNGTLKEVTTLPADARMEGAATTSLLSVGNFGPASIDDLMITVGGARHTTANFTPTVGGPTPYIYLPMDGPGDGDNVSSDFRNAVPSGPALIPSGSPSISSSSTGCGGCGNFASGSSLATTTAAGNVIGTRDFTIEFWVKHTGLGSSGSAVIWSGTSSGTFWDISLGNANFNNNADFAYYTTEQGVRFNGGDIGWGILPLNTWTHLSLTRLGTLLITHKNGVLVQTRMIAATDRMEGPETTSAITIGAFPSNLDDVMITIGTARHTTANFPVVRATNFLRFVATQPPFAFLPFDGANGSTVFPNLAANGVAFSPVSSPTITTAVSRYGGASGNFQAGYLTTPATAANVIGTRDFTIEFWVNFAGWGGSGTPVISGNGWDISLGNSFYNNAANFAFANQSARHWGGAVDWGILPFNTWVHLAVSRSQNRLYTHKNGVFVSVIDIDPSANMEAGAATSALTLGQSTSYLDDVSITVGSAKYSTADFGTPPQLTKPFMYLPMDGANLSTSFPNYGSGPAVSNVSSPTITTTGAVRGGACGNLTTGSLTTPSNSAYRLGTQDFTIEFWVKNSYLELAGSTVLSGNGWDISLGNTNYNNSATFAYYNTEVGGYRHWGGDIGWGTLPLNTWVHLALTRSGTRLYTHKNGVLMSVITIPITDAMEGPNTTSNITVGSHPCYMDDLMVTIGKARYTTANFTVAP